MWKNLQIGSDIENLNEKLWKWVWTFEKKERKEKKRKKKRRE